MVVIWLQQKDESIWHHATGRLGDGHYLMSCGRQLRVGEARLVWPVKAGESGPPPPDECWVCVLAEWDRDQRGERSANVVPVPEP